MLGLLTRMCKRLKRMRVCTLLAIGQPNNSTQIILRPNTKCKQLRVGDEMMQEDETGAFKFEIGLNSTHFEFDLNMQTEDCNLLCTVVIRRPLGLDNPCAISRVQMQTDIVCLPCECGDSHCPFFKVKYPGFPIIF